jgi:hypothetical protein
MHNYLWATALLIICHLPSQAQSLAQFFDGADTLAYNSIFLQFEPDSNNIWETGAPQNIIFDTAFSAPNAIVTDLDSTYSSADSSRFQVKISPNFYTYGIFAFEWVQKIDYANPGDGGMVEFRFMDDSVWHNAFTSPIVYNFYGFDSANVKLLPNGEFGFSSTDSAWKSIWLCFDYSYLATRNDSMIFRFTSLTNSDTINQEGWMIDNMFTHLSVTHSATEEKIQEEYLRVYPTLVEDIVYIEAKKLNQFHLIEQIELINSSGQVVQTFGESPTKFRINIGHHPPGVYLLLIQTNLQRKTFRLILQNP